MSNLTYIVFMSLCILILVGLSLRDQAKDRAAVCFSGDCIRIVHNAYEMKAFKITGPRTDYIEPVWRGDIPQTDSWRSEYEVDPEELALSFDQRNGVRNLFPTETSCGDDRQEEGLPLSLPSSFAIQMSSKEGTQVAILENGCDNIRLVKESGAALGCVMIDELQMHGFATICNDLWSCE